MEFRRSSPGLVLSLLDVCRPCREGPELPEVCPCLAWGGHMLGIHRGTPEEGKGLATLKQ